MAFQKIKEELKEELTKATTSSYDIENVFLQLHLETSCLCISLNETRYVKLKKSHNMGPWKILGLYSRTLLQN